MKPRSEKNELIVRLKTIWNYSPDNGSFTWKIDASRKFKKGSNAGHKDKRGYVSLSYKYTRYQAHRAAWAFYYGEWPLTDVDHINADKSDNRIQNLRLASRSQNLAFKPVRPDSASGRKGVYFDKRDGRFYPYIDVNGKRKSLGGFASLNDASQARQVAQDAHWKEFSWSQSPAAIRSVPKTDFPETPETPNVAGRHGK